MSTIPEPKPALLPTPWDVLDAAEACAKMLAEHFDPWGPSYSIERDQRYRDLWDIVINAVMEFPCFKGVQVPIEALPPTLAQISRGQWWWELHGAAALVEFQGDLLTALRAAGVPRRYALRPVEFEFWRRREMREDDPEPDPETSADAQTGADRGSLSDNPRPDGNAPLPAAAPEPAASEGNSGKTLTHATRRAAELRQRAHAMRAKGFTVAEIARRLDRDERTIYLYLSDSPPE